LPRGHSFSQHFEPLLRDRFAIGIAAHHACRPLNRAATLTRLAALCTLSRRCGEGPKMSGSKLLSRIAEEGPAR
jgi:hypothetical protein